jgi:subtilisin family serine protease
MIRFFLTASVVVPALVSLAASAVLAQTSALLPKPRQKQPHQTLADGKKVIGNELKITLREPAARTLSLDARGQAKPVAEAGLLALHPDIASIKARHTCSRLWLAGGELPEHLRRADGKIPRIARNVGVILRPGADATVVRAGLQRHPDIERVDLKYIADLDSTPNDSDYGKQWAPPITGLDTAWEVPGRGPVRVAVIDTGVRLSHPEFAGRVVFQNGYADFDTGDAPSADGAGFDHGTHVAGIICATRNNNEGVAGYSNDIALMVLNCASWNDDEKEWKNAYTDDAMDDAVANGASIINCSFGFSEDIEDEVEDAYDAGVLVVHAAGNDALNIGGHWESGSIALLTISATMQDGMTPASDVFAAVWRPGKGSNFGPGIDLAAPGTAIWSTVPGTIMPGTYAGFDGTSMAAPQVSGAAALMMTMNPGGMFNHLGVRHLLIRMAEDKGPMGYDQLYGFGALRLKKSTYQACRDATAFVSSASVTAATGAYDTPWRDLQDALNNVPNGATLMLNGGTADVPVYKYPPITITKPCMLSAIPDRPVVIGAP